MDAKPARPGDPGRVPSGSLGRSGSRPRTIGEIAGRLVAKPLGKRGVGAAGLIAAWPAIVGPALAASTLPLRVAFARGERGQGTLHLRVASGAVALELQHLGPLVIERINGHYGYAAVTRLALVQGPVPNRQAPGAAARRQPRGELDSTLAGTIAALPDEKLRDALADLGQRLADAWQRS